MVTGKRKGGEPSLLLAAVLAGLFVIIGLPLSAEEAETRKPRSLEEIMTSVEQDVLDGMNRAETLLKTEKRERSETTALWEETAEKYFRRFARVGHVEFESLLKKEGQTARAQEAREWSEGIITFLAEMESVGAVVEWRRKGNVELFQLDYDREQAPKRLGAYMDSMTALGRELEGIARSIRGETTAASVKSSLGRVTAIRKEMENVSVSLRRTAEYLAEGTGDQREMDRSVAAILSSWTSARDRHGKIRSDLLMPLLRWPEICRKAWGLRREARAKYDEAYRPFFEETYFRNVPFFGSFPYADLARPVAGLEMEIRERLLLLTHKELEEEQIRQEVLRDAELTQKEKKRVLELAQTSSPVRRRELELALARAGSAEKIREFELILARSEEGSSAFEEARRLLDQIRRGDHPDQVAASKALKVFDENARRAGVEMEVVIKEHRRRRETLGLAPEL